MKYIKLFENYEDQFDYTIEHIKHILELRGINFIDIKFLDSGGNGSVFELGNGDILKITNMKSEVFYANKLINIDSPYLIKIKDVFFHQYYDIGYTTKCGFILMEKLNTNKGESFKTFINYLYYHNPLSNRYQTVSDNIVLDYFKPKMLSLNDEYILKYWNIYKNILSECGKYDLPTDDLRGRNIGFRENSPVYFDIGDLNNVYKHDYSNIDIIQYNIDL